MDTKGVYSGGKSATGVGGLDAFRDGDNKMVVQFHRLNALHQMISDMQQLVETSTVARPKGSIVPNICTHKSEGIELSTYNRGLYCYGYHSTEAHAMASQYIMAHSQSVPCIICNARNQDRVTAHERVWYSCM